MNLESTKGWLYVIADFSVGEAVIEAVLRAGKALLASAMRSSISLAPRTPLAISAA
mgnify:CR=1 FL=1